MNCSRNDNPAKYETRRCADCHGEHLPDCNPFGSSGQLDPYDDMFEDMERGKAGAA